MNPLSMSKIQGLLIATRNRGKVREIKQALDGLRLKLRVLEEFPCIPTAHEPGESYAENAIAKARAYANQSGLPALADDSGLEVAALDHSPGVRSARFGGDGISDSERTSLLLSKLSSVGAEQRQARFICVMAIAQPNGAVINIETGICEGVIAKRPMGNRGFGYDPIFIPAGHDLTFAQMPSALKDRISHRGKALSATRLFLATQVESGS
jgi:XTP/dITP diphosphohydrolase